MDAAAAFIAVFFIILVLVLVYGPSAIALLKGQIVWGVLGIVIFAPLGWAGALMTAKPGSWWAKNRYDDAQRAEAIAKHGEPAPPPALATASPDAAGDWKCLICGQVSATRVAAESHVRGSHPPASVETSVGPV